MKALDFLDAFYRAKHGQDGLLADLSAVLASETADVRLVPFGCDQESIEWLDQRCKGNRRATLIARNDRLYEFRLDFTFKHAGQETSQSGRFFVLQHPDYPNVFVALTLESSVFFDRGLMPFLGGLYPKVLLTFVAHKRLRRLIEDFKERGGYQKIIITRASQRLRCQNGSDAEHVMPMVSWPKMSLTEAFEWVRQNNGWFQSIEFEIGDSERTLATISITRQGIVKANALLQRAYEMFTLPVCKTIHENITLFSRRARLARPDLSTSPLAIEFDTDMFSEVEENKRLIQAMRNMKTASVSVLHGNPYVHLSVLDYFDGSAFDLWVLDYRRIIIVPQLKATVPAIKRIINHVFDDYAEGRLSSYEGEGQ